MARPGPWQLSYRAACGLCSYIALLVLISSGILVKHALHEAPALYMATGVVRLVVALTSSAGLASYVYVASLAPRPHRLHIYGVCLAMGAVLNVGFAVGEVMEKDSDQVAAWLTLAFFYGVWAAYRTLFYRVLTDKLMVFGPPATRCQDISLWGRALIASAVLISFGGIGAWSFGASMLSRGTPAEDVYVLAATVPFPPDGLDVSIADKIALSTFISIVIVACSAFFVSSVAYSYVALHLVRAVDASLAARRTAEDSRTKVAATLRLHWLGLLLTLSSTLLYLVAIFIDGLSLLRQEDVEDLLLAVATLVDTGGDVMGILLLSGIGTVLFRKDPVAADVNGYIRSLLHAAVLTGRADFAFEGKVVSTPSRRCIVSFPGKYQEEWKALTWLCQREELSTACVFLPTSDPKDRFGKHYVCEEHPGAKCCWCTPLYGEVKPWGCLWFQTWKENIDRAVELGLDLVVAFFPGEVDEGIIEWQSLASSDLWDGLGLGGSQKGEVAYLRKHQLRYRSMDLDAVRPWLAI